MSAMALNVDQKNALDLASKGHNVVILGAAGTGKSHTVKSIYQMLKSQGKTVAVTCTTGIACNVYPSSMEAKTIHRWSGIGDNRYDPPEIVNVITSNPTFSNVVRRIKNTDVLIIDECSMLSKKTLESLNEVCSIKKQNLLFGGIQIILVGDFYQLPPVPCARYNEDGSFCFESDCFKDYFPHVISLTRVIRQEDVDFIKAIDEISKGIPTAKTIDLIRTLERPLPEKEECVNLFSTNELADDFNRDQIMGHPDFLHEFKSKDSGDRAYLTEIHAPKTLWLKHFIPVMLLKNLSDELVNGLLGTVDDIQGDTVVVEFPSINKIVPIEKFTFEVFDPRKNRVVATRHQYPLKPAFGITIHKAQGMTLERVQVDCRQIFKPGQLGVAIGRARSLEGLRVINFSERACLQQPEKVKTFMGVIPGTVLVQNDGGCCRKEKRPVSSFNFSVQDMMAVESMVTGETDSIPNEDEEFDEEFNQIIANIDSECENADLPHNMDLDTILQKLHTQNVLTPIQFETNSIISRIDRTRYVKFCKKQYEQISGILNDIQPDRTKALKSKDLGDFYSRIHKHLNSSAFKMSSLTLFENEDRFSNAHMHICFNISVDIRKFIIKDRAETIVLSSRNISDRSVTEASRARVRYIGGYCIAKVRHKYVKKKESHRYSLNENDKFEYERAKCAVEILNNLREEEQYLLSFTEEPESLLDVQRKQNLNRGLTNIPDNLFKFFLDLTNTSLSLLVDENLNQMGSKMFEYCRSELMSKVGMFEIFSRCCFNSANTSNLNCSEDSVKELLENMTFQVEQVEQIYKSVIKMYLLVMFNQFRKDLLDSFKVQKKMAHRKQVQVQSSSTKPAAEESKKPGTRKRKSQETASVPAAKHSDPELSHAAEPLSVEIPTSGEDNVHEEDQETEDTVKCQICDTSDTDTQWIQCDSCNAWLHRKCAGLMHHMKWKKYQKKGAKFNCQQCE